MEILSSAVQESNYCMKHSDFQKPERILS
jgi:hypothetical protein